MFPPHTSTDRCDLSYVWRVFVGGSRRSFFLCSALFLLLINPSFTHPPFHLDIGIGNATLLDGGP